MIHNPSALKFHNAGHENRDSTYYIDMQQSAEGVAMLEWHSMGLVGIGSRMTSHDG